MLEKACFGFFSPFYFFTAAVFPPHPEAPAFAVQLFDEKETGTPKPEIFPLFLILRTPIFSSKGKENFQILERKFLQNLRAEAGTERVSRIFSEKSSSLIIKTAQMNKTGVFTPVLLLR